MSELFDDEDEKDLPVDDEFDEAEEIDVVIKEQSTADARKRLESLLEEKRLRDDLDDFHDF